MVVIYRFQPWLPRQLFLTINSFSFPFVDWKPVVLRNPNERVERKQAAPKPQANPVAKADAEEEDFRIQTVGHDFKLALMKARQAKGWKQVCSFHSS